MAKYNIYKIKKDKESNLLEKLQTVGLSLAGQKSVSGFKLSFYFSKEPEDIDINQNLSIRDTLKSARGLDKIEAEMTACEHKFSDPNEAESSLELYGELIEQYQKLGGYSSDQIWREFLRV